MTEAGLRKLRRRLEIFRCITFASDIQGAESITFNDVLPSRGERDGWGRIMLEKMLEEGLIVDRRKSANSPHNLRPTMKGRHWADRESAAIKKYVEQLTEA